MWGAVGPRRVAEGGEVAYPPCRGVMGIVPSCSVTGLRPSGVTGWERGGEGGGEEVKDEAV